MSGIASTCQITDGLADQNGSPAGTTKLGIPVQALQVKIVPKGASAPGSTSDSYFETYRYMGYQTRDLIQRLVAIACSFLRIAPVTLRMSRLLEFLTTLRDRIASTHSSSVLVNISGRVISSLGLLGRGCG